MTNSNHGAWVDIVSSKEISAIVEYLMWGVDFRQ